MSRYIELTPVLRADVRRVGSPIMRALLTALEAAEAQLRAIQAELEAAKAQQRQSDEDGIVALQRDMETIAGLRAQLSAATHENERLRDLVEYAFREGMQAGAYSVEWTREWEDDEWLDSTTQAALASPAPDQKG